MFCTQNGLEYKYDLREKEFALAFEFLKREDLADLPECSIELGEGVLAHIQHYDSIKWEDGLFETHEKYFDVQYVIEGAEYCGVCSREVLGKTVREYDPQKDITFYEEPAFSGKVLLCSGDYVVLAPEDAHKPRCEVNGCKPVKKVVIKVPV